MDGFRLGPALLWLVCLASGGCLCPPRAEELLATGFRTPRQTLTSFQTFLRADLPLQEYRCFSVRFREEHDLSVVAYSEGRERLFREKPWLKLFAKAEVVGEGSKGEGEHWVDVRVLSRTIRVRLVREAFFEIRSGDQLLEDGYCEFASRVELEARGDGTRLEVRIPLEKEPEAYRGASEVLLARHWKIDGLHELETPDPAAP